MAPTPAGRKVFERLTTEIKASTGRQRLPSTPTSSSSLVRLLNTALWSEGTAGTPT
ncbi:MAG: hypothetical protein R2726_19220 [Acidimicrobiales bacterium]